MKWIIHVVFLFLLTWSCLAADKPAGKDEKPKPAQSIDELRQQIEKMPKDTHTNGVSIAIVHKNGPEWVSGLGRFLVKPLVYKIALVAGRLPRRMGLGPIVLLWNTGQWPGSQGSPAGITSRR